MRPLRAALLAGLAISVAACAGSPAALRAVPAQPASQAPYMGISVPGDPVSMAGVRQFAAETGDRPNLVSYYTGWYDSFDAAGTSAIAASGALPLIFIDSGRVPLATIVSGQDQWLASYAKAVAKYGHPVAISFDSDFNGPWWPWSFNHESAATYTAAWRKVVTVFQRAGATNVTWVWTIATSSPATTPLKPWWPGSWFKGWVGVNGYFTDPHSTFSSVFGPTFAQVRAFTRDPLLITETGASPASGRPRAIASLFAGAQSTLGLLGFIWFDYDKPSANGPNHNWRIDNDPAALAAFRAAVKEHG